VTRAVVTGASGLLGASVLRAARERLDFAEGWSRRVAALPDGTPLRRLDLRREGEAALREARPDLVIHCAALTDVDGCERDPDAARELNAEAPARLAAAAHALGARFVHVSTDAVYDGEAAGAHAEDEPPGPVNVYARTKLDGERGVLAAHPGALVVRTTMHGWSALGRLSFSEAILRGLLRGEPLTLFRDVRFSPLVVAELAELLLALGARDASGVLNVGAADAVAKDEFGRIVAREFGLSDAPIESVTLASRGLAAPRPRNAALDVTRLAGTLGLAPPTVAAGVRRMREDAAAAARLKGRGDAGWRALLEDPRT
jgi:dTDP-4-dehydrorhamnose reductase